MRSLIKISLLLIFLLPASILRAQESTTTMAETMRSNGKIYVVIAVIITILVGLILYMVRVDRKLSRLEKENKPR